jgi:Zn(2)-Cys(6) binuclear cluster domain-containing protein/transcription factor-like protein
MPSNEGTERPSRASLRRPNGRPQACEPCRKRKVACDNRQPVCRRCEKTSRGPDCQYIVDPRMSIVAPVTPAVVGVPPGSPTSSHASSRVHQPTAAVRRTSVSSSSFSPITDTPLSNPVTGPGYLGPTSFCGIYEEAEERLSLFREIACENARSHADAHIPTSSLPDLSPRTLETCLVVLRQIPLRKEAERLCAVYTNPNEMWYWLFGPRALASLYDTFGECLEDGKRSDIALADMAKRLCYNTSRPFPENEDEPKVWERQFSGDNFRWETLAILFTYWAFGTNVSTPVRCEIMQVPKLRHKMNDYLEGIDICIQLCRSLNNGNTFLLFVLFRRTILESMKSGDASPLVWRGQGDVVSHLTFLGLHAEPNPPTYVPTICSEWRRRLCYYVFNIDKVIAAFTGRPPAFSRRYLLTPWPLDLPDADLLSDKETLAKAAATQLDANGWNKSGIVGPSTICRARAIISTFRDEIFELAMGNGVGTTDELLW